MMYKNEFEAGYCEAIYEVLKLIDTRVLFGDNDMIGLKKKVEKLKDEN